MLKEAPQENEEAVNEIRTMIRSFVQRKLTSIKARKISDQIYDKIELLWIKQSEAK